MICESISALFVWRTGDDSLTIVKVHYDVETKRMSYACYSVCKLGSFDLNVMLHT